MKHQFETYEKERIEKRFGQAFFQKVDKLMDPLSLKWQINHLELINSFSSALIFQGESSLYGSIVMKFGLNPSDFLSEVAALVALKNKSVCKLLEVDFGNQVLLEGRIMPGTRLKDEQNTHQRVMSFCNLYNKLHPQKYQNTIDKLTMAESELTTSEIEVKLRETLKNHHYKSYEEWVCKAADYMENQEKYPEIRHHMTCAKNIYSELTKSYTSKTLLHGDLHYYNILKNDTHYTIIDPKGVIGHPIFDIPRYILNELWDYTDSASASEHLDRVLTIISQSLKISKEVLKKLIYIEDALAWSWGVEDGMTDQAHDQIIAELAFLHKEANLERSRK